MTFPVLVRQRASTGLYGHYIAEILKLEGFMDHAVVELDETLDLSSEFADTHVVLVSACLVSKAEAVAIDDFAIGGGTVIALQPSWLLSRQLGLQPTGMSYPGGFLTTVDGAEVGRPTCGGSQVVTAVLDFGDPRPGDDVLAWIQGSPPVGSPSPELADMRPAVVRFRRGRGIVILIAYDPGAAVAGLRHGEATAGLRSQGVLPYRCTDALIRGLDPDQRTMPQADMHTQLLTNLITRHDPAAVRFWYYNRAATTASAIQDSDDDWSNRAQFEEILATARRLSFRLTFYLMMGTRPTVLTDQEVTSLMAEGFSFGIHHDGVPNWEDGEDQNLVMERVVRDDIATFRARFGFSPLVNRNHCLAWWGGDELAKLYEELGVGMHLNAQGSGNPRFDLPAGSQWPIRHVDRSTGRVLDVYQQPTLIFDDESIADGLGNDADHEAELALEYVRHQMMDGFAPLTMQSHPTSFARYSSRFFSALWEGLQDLGVPIVSTERWNQLVRERDESTVRARLSGRELHASVVAVGESGQCLAVPDRPDMVVQVDGVAVEPLLRMIHGIPWRLVDLPGALKAKSHAVFIRW